MRSIPTNDAVRWSGTRFGLTPVLSAEAEQLLDASDSDTPALLKALADPERFVTAHVLLTKLTGVRYSAFPSWNGLDVQIQPNGSVHIDSSQIANLVRQWQSYFQADLL